MENTDVNKPATNQKLKENIGRVIAEIDLHLYENVIENIFKRILSRYPSHIQSVLNIDNDFYMIFFI